MSANTDKNEILSYIDKYGTYDKDRRTSQRSTRKKTSYQKVGKGLRKVVDLHGMTRLKAVSTLRKTFSECKRKGIGSILIIHGIGYHSDPVEGPVLKKTVRAMLQHEFRSLIRDFHTALPKDGGEGATVVRLRRSP